MDLEVKLAFHLFLKSLSYIHWCSWLFISPHPPPESILALFVFTLSNRTDNCSCKAYLLPKKGDWAELLPATDLLMHHSYTLCHICFWDLMNSMYDVQSYFDIIRETALLNTTKHLLSYFPILLHKRESVSLYL